MYRLQLKKLNKEQKKLRKRILELSFDLHLSHLGSCFTAVDIINAVYKVKKTEEKFVLSSGHAGIAWYAVLEKYGYIKDPKTTSGLNLHPDRNIEYDIQVSTGSLGQGLPIAVGMAISKRKRTVYCMLSDGECTEGSIWEAVRIASEQKLDNLKIIINANGYGAYSKIDTQLLIPRFKSFGCAVFKTNGHRMKDLKKKLEIHVQNKPLVLLVKTIVEQLSFLVGQDAHYKIINGKEYKQALEELK